MVTVADPYRILGLSHDATNADIKRAYRTLAAKLHPDKLIRAKASDAEIQEATSKFATISAAYTILSDDVRKRQYDHIYKYGGYDDPVEPTTNHRRYSSGRAAPKRQNNGDYHQANGLRPSTTTEATRKRNRLCHL